MKLAVVVVAILLSGGVARAAPLDAYGKLPTMGQVSISPDGTKVAFVQVVNGQQAVVVDRLNPPAIITGVRPTDQKVRALVWADPTHLLVVKSETGYAYKISSRRSEWYMVQTLDVEKRKSTPLFNQNDAFASETRLQDPRAMNTVYAVPEVRSVDGRSVVYVRGMVFVDSRGAPALISVDLASGRKQIIDNPSASGQDRSWVLDDRGAVIAQTTYDEISHDWTLRLRHGGEWIDAYAAKALTDRPEVHGISPDGASLILEIPKEDGLPEWRLISLADGKLDEPTRPYETFSSLIKDPVTQRIIGGVKIGMEPDYVFFNPKDQAAWNLVANTFPDEQVDLVDWSQDRGKVVVRVTGVRHGVAYEVVDLASRKAMEIGQAYDGIKPDDLASVQIATYRAKDGLPINAFLTLPNGRDPKNLPLIVLAHGGPAARDEAGFDWWAQALASRGYAVLQPQFRGSSGFGWKLEAAGFGEFGRKMQSDLSDGVRALAAAGYIDPKRVCIVGGSYGGYAALAGVTLEHGVYRCAVSVAGLSDLHKLIGGPLVDVERSSSVRYWDRFMGAKTPSDPELDQISPLHHAAETSAPILLIHGRDDTVVPIEQSLRMEAALNSANKPVELVTLDSEDHWLSREATRLQMLQATVAFLEKYNPPQ